MIARTPTREAERLVAGKIVEIRPAPTHPVTPKTGHLISFDYALNGHLITLNHTAEAMMLTLNSSWSATMSGSKLILRSHVFGQRFNVVASLAESLPVRLVPKQLTVATVRYDVVNHSRRCQLALTPALGAQRVSAKERFTDSPPASVVDVVLNPSVVLPLPVGMGFTVTPPCVRKTGTTGNGTRMARFIRHKDHPFIVHYRRLPRRLDA